MTDPRLTKLRIVAARHARVYEIKKAEAQAVLDPFAVAAHDSWMAYVVAMNAQGLCPSCGNRLRRHSFGPPLHPEKPFCECIAFAGAGQLEDSGHPSGEVYATEALHFKTGADLLEFTRSFDPGLICSRTPADPAPDHPAPAGFPHGSRINFISSRYRATPLLGTSDTASPAPPPSE